MPEVIVRKGEPVDRALKRLKNKLDAERHPRGSAPIAGLRDPDAKNPAQSQGKCQARPDEIPF